MRDVDSKKHRECFHGDEDSLDIYSEESDDESSAEEKPKPIRMNLNLDPSSSGMKVADAINKAC